MRLQCVFKAFSLLRIHLNNVFKVMALHVMQTPVKVFDLLSDNWSDAQKAEKLTVHV